jgi:hypothetical protein
MAATTKNVELIPQKELNNLIKYNEELLETKNNLADIIPVLHKAALGVETYTGDYKTLVHMLQTFEKTQQDTSKRVREHSNALSAVEKATKQFAYAQSAEAKEVALVKEQLRQKNAELRTNAREALAAEGSLNQLRAQLVQLKAEAANLDLNSKEFAEASARINELNGKIMKAEAAMGDHRRNVGNYASAFNNLGFQVQQVARELPSLTMGPQQFFLAISNNLPMLADAYAETIAKNKKLREENLKLAADQQKQVIPAWKQMLKSIVGWQTAIVVGITLLTTYGKEIGEFISGLFKGKKAIDATAFAQRQLNQAMRDGTVDAVKESTHLTLLYKAATDAARSMDERREAAEEMQRLYPDYFENLNTENIILGKALEKYQSLKTAILETAKARAAENLLVENNESLLKIQTSFEWGQIGALLEMRDEQEKQYRNAIWRKNLYKDNGVRIPNEVLNAIPEAYKAMKDIDKEINSLGKTIAEKFDLLDGAGDDILGFVAGLNKSNAALAANIDVQDLIGSELGKSGEATGVQSAANRLSEKRRAELELLEAQAQQEAAIQEQIYKDEERAYADRLDAFDKFKEAQQKVLEVQYTASREELDARLSGGDIDKDTYDAVLSSLDFANSEAFRELTDEQQQAGKELMEAIAEGMMSETTRAVEQSAQDLDRKMQDELLALSARYAAGEINAEEYEKERAAITDRYAVERFNTEIGLLDQLLNKEELTAEAREETEKAKDDAVLEYQKYINDQRIRENERVGDEEEKEAERQEQIAKKEAELKKQLLQEVFNLASALSDAQLDKELSRLDKLSEANQKWQDEETDRIDRLADHGVISDEQADARKKAIEEQAALREEEIEKKRIEAERKNTIFEKAQAVAQAAINTALAITAALKDPLTSAIMIPLIAATGAAQIATILATPLPEYAKGTQDHPGGLAMVGDGGRAEMVVFPDNRVWKTPATDTVVNLPAHTQVLPDYDAVLAQFAFSRFANMPSDMSRVEMLLEEEKLQRGMMLEKSTERNRLLRQIISNGNADRRYSQRYGVTYVLNYHKKLS